MGDYRMNVIEKLNEYGLTIEQYEELMKDVYDKSNGINDLDWQDIVDKYNINLNGNKINRDTIRKASQTIFGGIFVKQYMEEKYAKQSNPNDEYIKELEEKKEELFKETVRYRDKLREYNKLLRTDARIENLKQCIINSANIIAKENHIVVNKPLVQDCNDKVSVVQLSDWHFSNIVESYFNTYNVNVFYERLYKLQEDVMKYCDMLGIKQLIVLNQNDLVNGIIHVTTRICSEEDIISQTQHVAEALSKVLTVWCNHFDKVTYFSCLDNHSRTIANKSEHIEKENFSRFIDWFLEARLQNVNNLVIKKNEIDLGIAVIDILGEKAFATHGHQDKIGRIIQDLTMMLKIFPIAVFSAHIHHNVEDEVNGIDLIVNPSMEGSDDYSIGLRRTSIARQKMTVFVKEDNKVKRMATFFIEF